MGNAGLVLFPSNFEAVVVMYFGRVFLTDASRLLDDEGTCSLAFFSGFKFLTSYNPRKGVDGNFTGSI